MIRRDPVGSKTPLIHTLPAEELLRTAETLLEIPQTTLTDALDLELADGSVVADDIAGARCIFLAHLSRTEQKVADILGRLADEALPGRPSTPKRPSRGSKIGWGSRSPKASVPPCAGRWPRK